MVWIVEKCEIVRTGHRFAPWPCRGPTVPGSASVVDGSERPPRVVHVARAYPPLHPPSYPHKRKVIHENGPVIHICYVH